VSQHDDPRLVAMTLTCRGQPGDPQCAGCRRLDPRGQMRPVTCLTHCAMRLPRFAAEMQPKAKLFVMKRGKP
jgi:hypothetical protein